MKKFYITIFVCLNIIIQNSTAHEFETSRVDSHAPIGVMGDHTHKKGEIMLSYRYVNMTMSGMRSGNNEIKRKDLFDKGYSIYADDMEMQMHMIGAMYAP